MIHWVLDVDKLEDMKRDIEYLIDTSDRRGNIGLGSLKDVLRLIGYEITRRTGRRGR